jgi:hypothetical protein
MVYGGRDLQYMHIVLRSDAKRLFPPPGVKSQSLETYAVYVIGWVKVM